MLLGQNLPSVPKIPQIGLGQNPGIVGQSIKNIKQNTENSSLIRKQETQANRNLNTSTNAIMPPKVDRFGQEPVKNIASVNRPKNPIGSGIYGQIKQRSETANVLKQRMQNAPKPMRL